MKLDKRQSFFLIYPLVLSVIVYLYRYFNPLENILFPKCPVKAITGLDCPGCGGQRAAHLLLNGELKASFLQNPLLFMLVPYLLLGFYLQLIPEPTYKELQLRRVLYGQKAMITLGIALLLFTIIRNLI